MTNPQQVRRCLPSLASITIGYRLGHDVPVLASFTPGGRLK
jgi:hypothetical protein